MDFITIDFEIANSDYNSACSLGMVFVKDNEIVDEKYFLIQPPSLVFNDQFTEVHGLKKEDVKDAPRFDEVWNEIKEYFNIETYIIAHNAYFDLNVLKNCLIHYSLSIPEFKYVCSIPISTRACRGEGIGNSLKARLERFGIELKDHHNALADARACAELVLKCIKTKKRKSIHTYFSTYGSVPIKLFSELKVQSTFIKRKKSFQRSIAIRDITPTQSEINNNHPFYGKNFVFTGDLENLSRKDAMQKTVNVGGVIKSGVTQVTHYLVIGKQDSTVVGSTGMSSKERKAQELREKNINIQILREEEFLRLLEK